MSGKSKLLFLFLIEFQVFLPISCVKSQILKETIGTYNNTGGIVPFAVGGKPAEKGEFPFMAALGWKDDAKNITAFHAGGMVISNRMVLTSAHVVYRNGKLPDVIYIGGNPISEINSFWIPNIQFQVVNVTIFPNYDPTQGYDDIAILQLNAPSKLKKVCLWPSPKLPNTDATAIGYGLTDFAGSPSNELIKVNLTIFPIDYCYGFFKRERRFGMGLTSSQICAGDDAQDTCQGDSGGPLITRHNDIMYAVGITQSGQACAGFPPAIYTKIYPYIEWIKSVLKEQGESIETCGKDVPKKSFEKKRSRTGRVTSNFSRIKLQQIFYF
ncbi:serine protease snake-like [Eupeodes corollae]|uniref:serine protease snake-like n=1 Tax=Eupeodes corollae TaxID=290404 RepID=UPI00249180CD|nr:serine protease snake-like [Eupeodes corollae]